MQHGKTLSSVVIITIPHFGWRQLRNKRKDSGGLGQSEELHKRAEEVSSLRRESNSKSNKLSDRTEELGVGETGKDNNTAIYLWFSPSKLRNPIYMYINAKPEFLNMAHI